MNEIMVLPFKKKDIVKLINTRTGYKLTDDEVKKIADKLWRQRRGRI